MTLQKIVRHLERSIPLHYAASYDNVGLQIGNPDTTITGVLFTLDVTALTIKEAQKKGCNLIVTHHPLIFKPLYHIGQDHVGEALSLAIKNDIAIYAAHTNFDHLADGINQHLASQLMLTAYEPLSPLAGEKNCLLYTSDAADE